MMASNAVIGGEGSSGGVIWPAVHLCRDSFSAMALILEMLAERDCTVDEILDSLPRYYSVTGKFECGAAASGKILYGLKKKYRGCNLNTLDGVRIDFSGNSWVLVRPSNTEPVVRITAEASTPPEAERILKRFSAEIISLLKG
jgi:phosphomannomutase